MFVLSLRDRLITFMSLFTLLLISAFTIVQLNIEMNNMVRLNTYQAHLNSIVVKTRLESGLANIQNAKDIDGFFSGVLKGLAQDCLFKEVSVVTPEYKVVASSEPWKEGSSLSSELIPEAEQIFKYPAPQGVLLTKVDSQKQTLCMVTPLNAKVGNEDRSFVVVMGYPLPNIQAAFSKIYKQALLVALLVVVINVLFGYFLTQLVVSPIKVLNSATKEIAGGNLALQVSIKTGDELAELADTFNEMARALIVMKRRAEDANPLTKLPGNVVIREEVDARIKEGKKFAVLHSDLANFKAFNDKYGLSRGDEAIRLTAEILKEAASQYGNPDDLVGHEGGDDFVLVTTPAKVEAVAASIIREFDERIRSLYEPEDLEKGYIIAHSRQGEITQFPVMSISLSGVSNLHRQIDSYVQVTNITAEVKGKAKSIEGSAFVMDKRIL